jgi:polysaccharide export outer membrane protein
MKNQYIALIIIALLTSSCVPSKDILYLQGSQNSQNSSSNYEPLIQKDDLLFINISSSQAEAVAPFNLDSQSKDITSSTSGFSNQKQTYLVDNMGNIEFPIIGTLNAGGYSVNEFRDFLKNKLKNYVNDAVINIRIVNFKVTVTGEVGQPGVVSTNSQRFTLFDAIAMSGDLTLYGRRDNILIVRDFQGIKSYNRVDITKADFVNSPFYYLDQNDLIYVEPKKTKINSTAIGTNIPFIVSVVGLLITTTLIVTK